MVSIKCIYNIKNIIKETRKTFENKELKKKMKEKIKNERKLIDKIAGSSWKIIEKYLQLISTTAI